ATHRAGIMRLDSTRQNPAWETPDINSGLPLRDLARGRFITVDTLAANPAGTMLMAGVAGTNEDAEGEGIYRAADQGAAYAGWKFARASTSRFTDKVTLPETWLFASGDHEITVVSEDETG
ncbi:MAG: putative baseplate assembly protein, partial [Anaerolineae bacterium]|nr:putative baseplate assembly protein [Anaerolineae bacterium]